jgi:hypothetical protein
MFNRFLIVFFYFFIFSRFFSEKLQILPKWIDLINFPLFLVLFLLLLMNLRRHGEVDSGENSYLFRYSVLFVSSYVISLLLYRPSIVYPAAVLFLLGHMEGPLLYFTMNKLSKDPLSLAKSISRLFFILIFANFIIVFLIDLPIFLITKNPDVISGTYGLNTYQFSMLLMLCGGYLLGYNFIKKSRGIIVALSQFLILFVFYLSQFRAALPFFLLSYGIMLFKLYGSRIVKKFVYIIVVLYIILTFLIFFTEASETSNNLKFQDWVELLSDPQTYLSVGKIKIYDNILRMYRDYPETFFVGVGPGNFLSRAYHTFSFELTYKSKTKGNTKDIINDVFGIKKPNFNYFSERYSNYLRLPNIFGTYQLSNPQSSYIAALTEIGIMGGISIIAIYLLLFLKSLKYIDVIKEKNPDFVPLSIALVGGTSYLFALGFLDCYWEMARVTLPVWLLFWAVKNAVYEFSEFNEQYGNR